MVEMAKAWDRLELTKKVNDMSIGIDKEPWTTVYKAVSNIYVTIKELGYGQTLRGNILQA